MTSSAGLLRALVRSLDRLEHDDPSLTIDALPDGWEVAVDIGPEVDDVFWWVGEDLSPMLSEALRTVSARPRRAWPDPEVAEDHEGSFEVVHGIRRALTTRGVLDMAYVPRSTVTEDRCWEVRVVVGGLDEIWLTDTLQSGLEPCWRAVQAHRGG